MTILNEVKLYAETMELGETARIVCPHCGGGSTKERSLTITLFDDMTVKYQCFRGMCSGVRGNFKLINTNINKDYETTTSLVPLNSKDKEKDKLFNGIVTELTKYEKALIRNKWRIDKAPHWYHTPEYGGRVAMSIRSPRYTHRGWVLRDMTGRSQYKALTYLENKTTPLSWYIFPMAPHVGTIIVEDIPSAVRASKWITKSVALLGTGCGPDRALEIASNARRPILVALDQDATGIACNIVEKHNLLWGEQTKVVPLKKDLKDMEEEDLYDLIMRSL